MIDISVIILTKNEKLHIMRCLERLAPLEPRQIFVVDCFSVDEISIGDQALVSQDVKLCAAGHDISSRIMELTCAPIVIGADSWVSGWSTVFPGVTIGEGAVVAAGAVVTKDVEPWTVVGGNPAKFIKKRVLNG